MSKTFTKKTIYFVNVLMIAIGVIVLFCSLFFVQNEIGREILVAVGTGLVAAGLVNLFDRYLVEKPPQQAVTLLSTQRKNLGKKHHDQKYSASKFDLLAVSMLDCLKEIVDDKRMIEQILFANFRMQLVFVDPNAVFIRQRAFEDKMSKNDLIGRQKQSVTYVVEFYKKISQAYETARENGRLNENKVGNIEIKVIKVCPYITIERFDDEIFWGLYTSAAEGKNCTMLSVKESSNHELFDQLKKHFYALLNRAPGNYLLTLTTGGPPKLYSNAIKSIIGEDNLENILADSI